MARQKIFEGDSGALGGFGDTTTGLGRGRLPEMFDGDDGGGFEMTPLAGEQAAFLAPLQPSGDFTQFAQNTPLMAATGRSAIRGLNRSPFEFQAPKAGGLEPVPVQGGQRANRGVRLDYKSILNNLYRGARAPQTPPDGVGGADSGLGTADLGNSGGQIGNVVGAHIAGQLGRGGLQAGLGTLGAASALGLTGGALGTAALGGAVGGALAPIGLANAVGGGVAAGMAGSAVSGMASDLGFGTDVSGEMGAHAADEASSSLGLLGQAMGTLGVPGLADPLGTVSDMQTALGQDVIGGLDPALGLAGHGGSAEGASGSDAGLVGPQSSSEEISEAFGVEGFGGGNVGSGLGPGGQGSGLGGSLGVGGLGGSTGATGQGASIGGVGSMGDGAGAGAK
jgi:hypothetical protein